MAGATKMESTKKKMANDITLRRGEAEEAAILGQICYDAFTTISNEHNFPPDFPSPEVGTGFMSMMLSRPDIYSVVAEKDGAVTGSNFIWLGDEAAGIGPITIDPNVQNSTIGRQLMDNVIEHAEAKGFSSIRLVQAAFHNRSLALYTKLGFNTVEPLSVMQGRAIGKTIDGLKVRAMEERDIENADSVCRDVYGVSRRNEIAGAVQQGSGTVAEKNGEVTGYSTGVAFFGHTVARTNDDLKALIAAAPEFGGPGFLLPTRNGEVMRWCLENGLRVVQPMTLMCRGDYSEPRGAFIPSILY